MLDEMLSFDFTCEVQRSLLQFWRSRLDRHLVPGWPELDAPELERWHGDLSLLQRLPGSDDYRCMVHGANVVRRTGQDRSGRLLSHFPEPYRSKVFKLYRIVHLLRSPLAMREGEDLPDGRFWACRLLLPVSSDGDRGQADRIVVHTVFSLQPCDTDQVHCHLFGFRQEALRLLDLL